ncbi:MAG TPA: hypothetical protein VJI70_04105 [Candidatus Paceibacterota bacterium]
MKTIFDHIERVKGKPHHVRKRVAFGVAAFGAALIALVWLVGSLGTGAFALKDTSFAQSIGQEGVVVAGSENGSPNIAGVGAALSNTSAPAHIEIVDTTPSKAQTKKAEPTVIPF